jgi:hypothetical protein
MTSLYAPPLIPGIGSNVGPAGNASHAQTRNPFFSVANQFLPRNLHDVIRWVRFITVQSPVTTEVIRKLSTYPITNFIYDSKDPAIKDKYEQIVKSFRLKSTLHDIGFQYFTIGNVFISIYYPISRFYGCPNCNAQFGAQQANFLKFRNYAMNGTCPSCGQDGQFNRRDEKSQSIKDMNLIIWDPLNISVNHNPITGKSKYYYQIPNDIKKKVQMGDRLTVDTIPWEFIEAIKEQKDFEFTDDFIFHMRNVDMGMAIDGISIPPLISHFSLVFYQTTLRRANESIATDFMAPMRVIFPQPQTANSDPVVSISMRNFTSKMEEALIKHKHDNNHVLIAPVPIGYQAISGEGKALLVNQEIAQAEESLLLSMGVSRELLSGTTNWTSSTVGLRMLKNTLDSYMGQIEEILDWITSKVSSYLNLVNSQIRLTPFQLTDDDTLKNMLAVLAQNGNVSLTTVYEAMGRSYEDELERMNQDAKRKARHDVRTKFEVEQSQYLEGLEINKLNENDDSYMETLQQCQQMAGQLLASDPLTIREVLNQLQIMDYAKFLLVSRLLQEGSTSQMAQESNEAQLANQSNPGTPQASSESGDKGGPSGGGGGGGSVEPQDPGFAPPQDPSPGTLNTGKNKAAK